MRTIERTTRFEKDFKREGKRQGKGRHRETVADEATLQLVRLGSHSALGI